MTESFNNSPAASKAPSHIAYYVRDRKKPGKPSAHGSAAPGSMPMARASTFRWKLCPLMGASPFVYRQRRLPKNTPGGI